MIRKSDPQKDRIFFCPKTHLFVFFKRTFSFCGLWLLQCSTPKETKKMGERFMKKLGIADDIYRDVQLLRLAIRVKYNCCKEFKAFLDNHPDIPIVEYAWWGDDEYGCVDEKKWLKCDWTQGSVIGKNVCGRIIRGVRDEPKDDNGQCVITRPECLDTMRPLTLFS